MHFFSSNSTNFHGLWFKLILLVFLLLFLFDCHLTKKQKITHPSTTHKSSNCFVLYLYHDHAHTEFLSDLTYTGLGVWGLAECAQQTEHSSSRLEASVRDCIIAQNYFLQFRNWQAEHQWSCAYIGLEVHRLFLKIHKTFFFKRTIVFQKWYFVFKRRELYFSNLK